MKTLGQGRSNRKSEEELKELLHSSARTIYEEEEGGINIILNQEIKLSLYKKDIE